MLNLRINPSSEPFDGDRETAVINIDATVDRLLTVSDEEDGLLRYNNNSNSRILNHNGYRVKRRNAGEHLKAYPKEAKKTLVALLIMFFNFVLTTASLSVIHEYMPDYPPLPDLLLDQLPYVSWALKASEVILQAQVILAIVIIVFHRHR